MSPAPQNYVAPCQDATLPRATEATLERVRANVPAELRELRAWVGADRTPRSPSKGVLKSSKMPLDPHTGAAAKSNDPTTWSSFDEALAFAERDDRCFGVGVNLLGGTFLGLDFDNVIEEDGVLNPQAADLLEQLPPTYLEVSPSGRGLRAFFRGQMPQGSRSAVRNAFGEGAHLEIYDGTTGGRYLTVTGNVWGDGTRPIHELSGDEAAPLLRLAARPQPPASTGGSRTPLRERTLIASALHAIPPWVERPVWVRAIFAVHAACGGDDWGEHLVESWSACSDLRMPDGSLQYQDGEASRIYRKAALPDTESSRRKVTVHTLFAIADQHGWMRPLDASIFFEDIVEEREGFPVSSLPPAMRAMVTEGADAQGVDPALWAVPLLGILSGCIGATRQVRLSPDWVEPAVLWTAVIAPSGAGKTPPLRALLQPVRDHDYRLHAKTVEQQKQFAEDCERRKAIKPKERGPKPQPPGMLAALIDDATLEAVCARLADNPRGLLLAMDELAGFLKGFDRYRKSGGDEQAWLSIHNCNAIKVDRKTSSEDVPARLYVRRAAVSITGTIQPGVARRYLGAVEKRESGMCARLLLAAPPVMAAKWTNRSVPEAVRDDYSRVVKALLELDFDCDGNPIDITLSPRAEELFIAFHDENGRACATAGRDGNDDLAAALSKLRGAAARIALVLALARAAEEGRVDSDLVLLGLDASSTVVGELEMQDSITIVRWFEGEARRLYTAWADEAERDRRREERQSLQNLADRVHEILGRGPRTLDQLHEAMGRNLTGDRLRAALDVLLEAGRAVTEKQVGPNGGRPRETWRRT